MLDLALMPETSEVRDLTRVVLLKRRRYRALEEQLLRAVELDPPNVDAVNNLGLAIARQRGRRREAIDVFARAARLDPQGPAGKNLHDSSKHWVGYAGLVASWVIFRMIRTAWMSGDWQGLWNPWILAAWSAVAVCVAWVLVRRRRADLPAQARDLLDDVARRTRAARRRNPVFDGLLLPASWWMWWAIETYPALQDSMGLRALMFCACLAVGVTAAALFRRLTGSSE